MRIPNQQHTPRINTKTHSAFNLLKQLGFAVLLLGVNALAQQGPETLWSRTYSIGSGDAKDLAVLADGNIVIVGYLATATASWDVYALALNDEGDSLWLQTYSTPYEDYCDAIKPTADGGYAITSWQFRQFPEREHSYFVRADSTGGLTWDEEYERPDGQSSCLEPMPDGGFAVGGSFGLDPCVARVGQLGDSIWTRIFAFTDLGQITSIRNTQDGGLICSGHGQNPEHNENRDAFILKLTASGETEFVRWYGWEERDWGNTIIEVQGRGFLMAGQTEVRTDALRWNGLLVRTDTQGDTLWTRIVELGDFGLLKQVVCTGTDYVVSGSASLLGNPTFDLILARFNDDGDLIWINNYPGTTNFFYSSGLAVLEDYSYVVCASLFGNASPYVVRTVPDTALAIDSERSDLIQDFRISAFPNPFNSTATLRLNLPIGTRNATLTVSNILGQQVEHKEIEVLASQVEIQLSADNWPSGIYLARAEALNKSQIAKLVLLK